MYYLIFRKILLVILAVLLLAGSAVSANSVIIHLDNLYGLDEPPDITAAAAVIVNMRSGVVLYEKNGSIPVYPASAVRVMTAILTVEHIENPSNNISLDTPVIISRNVVLNTTELNVNVREGEVFTVEDMLNAALLHGANDACLALAELISGSVPAFVEKMNARARELGAHNTNFTNPTGLHNPEMVTTALDMAKISFHAANMPLIMDISSSPRYEIPSTNMTANPRTLLNRNHFVSRASQTLHFFEGAKGLNSGATPEAGHILITVVGQPDNVEYLCVIMGATQTFSVARDTNIPNSFSDARRLLNWAFSIYSYRTVLRHRQPMKTLPVELSANNNEVTLIAAEEVRLLLPQNMSIDNEIDKIITLNANPLTAPIEQGDILGEIALVHRGETVARANLLAASSVERSNLLHILNQIRTTVTRPWFIASVIIFLIMCAVYIVISIMRINRRDRIRKRKRFR